MTKHLHKEILKSSRLRNIFLKDKTETNTKSYKTQRNFCKKLLKTYKKPYFRTPDTKKYDRQHDNLEDHFASHTRVVKKAKRLILLKRKCHIK